MRRVIRASGILLTLLAIAGCDGGGNGGGVAGPDADAPQQLNFQIRALTPERTGITVRYGTVFALRDPNDDLVGGRAEIRAVASGRVVGFPLGPGSLVGDCTAQCRGAGIFFLTPTAAGRLELVHYVIDAAGHRSNEVPFFITIAAAERPAGGRAPSGPPPSGYESTR